MTAVLDKPSGRAVFSVIERIAHDYPSALFFPLSISSEQYVFNQDQNALAAKKKVEELKETLKSPLMEKFKFELKRLTEPAHIFKDWLERTDALIRSEGPDKLSAIMAAFEEMKAYCLEDHDMGEVGKAFASKHSANLIKMCGNVAVPIVIDRCIEPLLLCRQGRREARKNDAKAMERISAEILWHAYLW